tara:strand:+ start:4319 stop:4879 length:561 start_codon:yes stop_codon:yes gene_type:complete
MELLFKTYERYKPSKVCFLNSDFVDQVLGEYTNYSKKYIICTISDNGTDLDTSGIKIVKDGPDSLIRLRIRIIANGKSSYHINLLIIDHLYKTIKRFEPLNDFEMSETINHTLIQRFSKSLPDYTFEEYDFHPQRYLTDECKDLGLCVAHVIRFGVFHLFDHHPEKKTYDDKDIFSFSAAIVKIYT